MKKHIKTSLCALAGAAVLTLAPVQVIKSVSAGEQPRLYDLEKILTPVWEENTCYQESVLPVRNTAAGDVSVCLLYPIERVIEVQNAQLTVTYQEGIDYSVKDGELIILEGGAIPVMSYQEFHPQNGVFKNLQDGGYLCFNEGTYFHERQIVITYTHKAKYYGYIPEKKGDLLPKLQQKLTADRTLDMFVLGDSISVGANSSNFTCISPFMPNYAELFADGLRQNYSLNQVKVYNYSVGGKDSAWGVTQIESALDLHENIDVAVLAFGMNDGGLTPTVFCNTLKRMINAVQTKFPQAEILVVATMLPNPKSEVYQNQALFAQEMLQNLQTEGVAVVNMTALHESLLTRKGYADMTGNNINHPNDYLARVYAQALLTTVQKEAGGQPDNSVRGCSGAISGGICTPLAAALCFRLYNNRRKRSEEN